jgi:hypothetical protein
MASARGSLAQPLLAVILPRHIAPLDQERRHKAVGRAVLFSHAAFVAARKAADVAEAICTMPEIDEALEAATLALELARKAKAEALAAARAEGTLEVRMRSARAIRLAKQAFAAVGLVYAARDRSEGGGEAD